MNPEKRQKLLAALVAVLITVGALVALVPFIFRLPE